jgi:hypothetical protein
MAVSRADSFSRVPVVGMAIGLATIGSNLLKGAYDVACIAKNKAYGSYLTFRHARLTKFVVTQGMVAANTKNKAEAAKIETKIDATRQTIAVFARAIEQETSKKDYNKMVLQYHMHFAGKGVKRCVPGYGTYFWKLPK